MRKSIEHLVLQVSKVNRKTGIIPHTVHRTGIKSHTANNSLDPIQLLVRSNQMPTSFLTNSEIVRIQELNWTVNNKVFLLSVQYHDFNSGFKSFLIDFSLVQDLLTLCTSYMLLWVYNVDQNWSCNPSEIRVIGLVEPDIHVSICLSF